MSLSDHLGANQRSYSAKGLGTLPAGILTRIKNELLGSYTLEQLPDWVRENTLLNGAPFSFVDHEFQLKYLSDASRIKIVRKCAQVGLSEVSVRETLGIMDILPGINAIYTLPSANFAVKFSKTRFDDVIQNSPYLRDQRDKSIDSSELKHIGRSYLHLKGTVGQATAISVPGDLFVADEVDFSDQERLSQYSSRLQHSRYKLERKFSTPSVPKFGIDEAFALSRRNFLFAKCNHCAFQFLPDYFEHVHIPGFDLSLKEVTKDNLASLRWDEARVLCPKCGRIPDLAPENREWVVENPYENHEAAGYQISPFDVPKIRPASDLVRDSTKYKRYTDFVNFVLGKPAQDELNGLNEVNARGVWFDGEPPRFVRYVVGMDMGMTIHVVVGGVLPDGGMCIVHMERIPLHEFDDRIIKIYKRFPMAFEVADALPYTDLVMRLQKSRSRLYAARYTSRQISEVFNIIEVDPDESHGLRREVAINRSLAFDTLTNMIADGGLTVSSMSCGDEREIWVKHALDMRRVAQPNREGEMRFIWQKSLSGEDHYYHATLYAMVAAQSAVMLTGQTAPGLLLSKFKTKGL